MTLTVQATVRQVAAELGIHILPTQYGGHVYTAGRRADAGAGHPRWQVTLDGDTQLAGLVEAYWSEREDAWRLMAMDGAGGPLGAGLATYHPGAVSYIHESLFYRDGSRWVRKHDVHGGPHDEDGITIPQHSNNLGDWCPFSGQRTHPGATSCPQNCRDSARVMDPDYSDDNYAD